MLPIGPRFARPGGSIDCDEHLAQSRETVPRQAIGAAHYGGRRARAAASRAVRRPPRGRTRRDSRQRPRRGRRTRRRGLGALSRAARRQARGGRRRRRLHRGPVCGWYRRCARRRRPGVAIAGGERISGGEGRVALRGETKRDCGPLRRGLRLRRPRARESEPGEEKTNEGSGACHKRVRKNGRNSASAERRHSTASGRPQRAVRLPSHGTWPCRYGFVDGRCFAISWMPTMAATVTKRRCTHALFYSKERHREYSTRTASG